MAYYKAQVTDGNPITPIAINTNKTTGRLTMVNICNNAAYTVAIDVYLYDASNEYFIIKGVDIPTKTSLILDHEIQFDNSTTGVKIHGAASSGSEDYDVILTYYQNKKLS